jgi:hypothetical protein
MDSIYLHRFVVVGFVNLANFHTLSGPTPRFFPGFGFVFGLFGFGFGLLFSFVFDFIFVFGYVFGFVIFPSMRPSVRRILNWKM